MSMKSCELLSATLFVHAWIGTAIDLRGSSTLEGFKAWRNLGPDRNAYDLVHFLDLAELRNEGVMISMFNTDEGSKQATRSDAERQNNGLRSSNTSAANSSASQEGADKKESRLELGKQQRVAFVPQCLRHVEMLLGSLDQAYTDVHLETVLMAECQLAEHFPKTRRTGFTERDGCEEFATKLVAAREQNLKDGTIGGYERFCNEYASIVYGEPIPKKSGVQHRWGGLIHLFNVFVVILAVVPVV